MKITHQKHGGLHFIRIGNFLTLSFSRPRKRRLTHLQRESRATLYTSLLCLLSLPLAGLAGIYLAQFLFTLTFN